jgi:hypothetical protein
METEGSTSSLCRLLPPGRAGWGLCQQVRKQGVISDLRTMREALHHEARPVLHSLSPCNRAHLTVFQSFRAPGQDRWGKHRDHAFSQHLCIQHTACM